MQEGAADSRGRGVAPPRAPIPKNQGAQPKARAPGATVRPWAKVTGFSRNALLWTSEHLREGHEVVCRSEDRSNI